MTQEALIRQLQISCLGLDPIDPLRLLVDDVIEALAQTQEPVAVYGYCPECGAKGVMRERRPNGTDKCANGHTYPSNTAAPPQRTWVGLTEAERIDIIDEEITAQSIEHFALTQAIEAKLKELNT
jgi:hypothetical protein